MTGEPMDIEAEAAAVADRAVAQQKMIELRDLADRASVFGARLWYQWAATEMPEDFRRAMIGQAMECYWEAAFGHCHHEGEA